jgi:hypothetical protein
LRCARCCSRRPLDAVLVVAPEDGAMTQASIDVGDGVTRYDWSIAFSRTCLRNGYPDFAIAAAMRLIEFLERGQSQCAPGRDLMVAELGVSKRQIDRALQFLESEGWIKRKRGGSTDAVVITLSIPVIGADIHRFGYKGPTGIRANMLAHMNGEHTRQNPGSYAPENEVIRATQAGACNPDYQKEQSAAKPPRAPEVVERESCNGNSAPMNGASDPTNSWDFGDVLEAHPPNATCNYARADVTLTAMSS